MLPITITVKDAAAALGIGRTKLYELVRTGRLKLIKIDRRSVITTESIRDLLTGRSNNESKSQGTEV
jgi:excisionase family DNA binding protein